MAHFVFLFFKNTQKISHNNYIRIIHGGSFNVDVKKYILISINATHITGNPYKDIETPGWRAKALYFTYFDKNGIQIGRMRTIKLQRGQAISKELINDIENDDVIKLSFAANTTRIYLSKLLDYPVHNYLSCSSWADIQVLARLNGYKADTVTQLAKTLGTFNSSHFSMLIKCVKRLTASGCINLTQLAGYFATQKINDQSVAIDTNLLEVCIKLIEKYNKAIIEFESNTNYPVSCKNITRDFCDKYNISSTDEIYMLLDDPSQLSDLEVDLIHILMFKNSKIVKLIKKISNSICHDGKLRGMINFFQNKETGFNGYIDLFDRRNKIISVSPKEVIRVIKNNKQINIRRSPMIIKRLKALLPLLLSFDHQKIIIDLSKATEYAMAKLSGCDWRIKAFESNSLDAELRSRWISANYPNIDIIKLDTKFVLGIYHTNFDESIISEWKEFNRDIIFTRGNIIYAAHRALQEKKQIWFQGVIFDHGNKQLLIYLTTGRTIRMPVEYNQQEIKISSTGKRLTGAFLFRLICQSLQRDVLIHILVDLLSKGYNVAYYSNSQIVIDDANPLTPQIMYLPCVTIIYDITPNTPLL